MRWLVVCPVVLGLVVDLVLVLVQLGGLIVVRVAGLVLVSVPLLWLWLVLWIVLSRPGRLQ